MPTSTVIVNGFSILSDPKINANSSGGGNIMIHGGTAIFEPDDIIVFEALNTSADGELTVRSKIVGVTVYDNASAYFAGTPKYVYGPEESNDYAEIRDGVENMGDTYVRFDAENLVSSDPTAPELNKLILTPGVDLSGDLKGTPVQIATKFDVDYNKDLVINSGTAEVGNRLFSSQNNVLTQICLARGTLIECPGTPRRIETLEVGDLVNTLDHGAQPIRWIGSRRVAALGRNAPVRIRAGSLGNISDLWVSQNHRMLIRGPHAELLFGETEVLVAAKHLVNDSSIRIIERPEIEYFHFLFDTHQIVFAEACPTESLFPGNETLNAVTDEARDEIIELFPELRHAACVGTLSRYELSRIEAQALRHVA